MSETSMPISTKSCSIPGGDRIIINFAISLVSFLKLCKTFGGTLTNVPGLASILCLPTLNVSVLQLRKTLRVHVFECVGQDLLLEKLLLR